MKTVLITLTILTFCIAGMGQSGDDKAAVKQAAMDYIEAVYNVNPAQVERSVHPELVKRGFYAKPGDPNYSANAMTYAQLVELAKTYNTKGRIPKDAPREVVVFDVADQTASVKVTAAWGIDYMHLAKYEGKWKIINILWQSPPKKMAGK